MQRGTRLDNGLGALFAAARRRVDPDRPNNSVPGLTVWGDTVRADRLAKTNVIRRTESVVFRAEVARDGVVVPDLEVTVQIGRTAPLPMVFGTARRGEPHYRTDPWPVPLNLRVGPLPYTLTALDRATGTSASWSPLPGPRSGLTILPYAYTVVVGAVRLDHAVRVAATVTRTVPGEHVRSGTTIGISYLVGGIVPLLPYFLPFAVGTALLISAALTLATLFAFGWIRGRLTGITPARSALQAVVVGGLAAGVAFSLARVIAGAR